jgi:tetratricopeptide (TPR) repeat protein
MHLRKIFCFASATFTQCIVFQYAAYAVDSKSLEAEANESFLRRNYKDAIDRATESLKLDPKNISSLLVRASARQSLGDDNGAVADCNALIQLEKDDAAAHITRGNSKIRLREYDSAIADFNEAINRLDADARGAAKIRSDMTKLHRVEPKPDETQMRTNTVSLQSKASDLLTSGQRGTRSVAFAGRGQAKACAGRYKEAVADFDQAIAIDNEIGWNFFQRGMAKMELGDNNGALADLNTAERLTPSDRRILKFRSDIKMQMGDNKGAAIDLANSQRLKGK